MTNNTIELSQRNQNKNVMNQQDDENGKSRVVWKNQFEFLFSCIAMSVGLG
jgi:hypothetical protein